MFYESLFNPSIHRPVKACLTGAGEFGASFLFQAQGMPLLEVPAVCTRTVQRAVDAYENAGIPASKVRVCESAEDAKKAYADGFNVVVDSFEYIADLPLDVLVESSGAPEASAAAAELAIERGMHVVMVSKETDSVVGSILARKAAERGLVYTTGAWNSGRSGIMPVALATTAISQRSGTERCESEVSMARRLPTTSSAGRSPNCHSEPMPGVAISCFWPGQSTMSRAGS